MFYYQDPLYPKGWSFKKMGMKEEPGFILKFLAYPQKYGEFDPGSG